MTISIPDRNAGLLGKHRREKTDPTQEIVDYLIRKLNTPDREQLLSESLRSTLIACGVLREDCCPSGPELLCASMTFCEGEE
jgi:hypothetical protein